METMCDVRDILNVPRNPSTLRKNESKMFEHKGSEKIKTCDKIKGREKIQNNEKRFSEVEDVSKNESDDSKSFDLVKEISAQVENVCLKNSDKRLKKTNLITSSTPKISRRPEGMAREVFALLYNDKKDVPPLFPTDTGHGYKNTKADLSMKNVRPWRWMPFTNPARNDNAVFHHWQRICDEGKEYPFARFNKKVQIPSYTDLEYNAFLINDNWSKAETDHLFDLAERFDIRFGIMTDRWDLVKFKKRSIEDLKERYYGVCSAIAKVRDGPGISSEMKNYVFDAEHERKRKEQLAKLYNRTKEQVEEEQFLLNELRKIEARKKERDKKTQDLQKLITAADCQAGEIRRPGRIAKRKLAPSSRPRMETLASELSSIKFPDLKGSGVYLRSQRMKLPANIGQKKIKAIEQLLAELNIEANPTPTEEICQQFNELRSDLLLLHELRVAMGSCEFELQSLRHQYEASHPGKTLVIPPSLLSSVEVSAPNKTSISSVNKDGKDQGSVSTKMDIIDVEGSLHNLIGS